MIMIKTSLLATALLLAAPIAASEFHGRLLPATDGDLVPSTLSTAKAAIVADLESEPVDFAWAIDADSKLHAVEPYVAESREFWSLQSPAELQNGFRFNIASPGALIRISPAEGSKSAALGEQAISLSLDGRALSDGNGILRSAPDDQLKALGTDFGDGSRVLQLDPALGIGAVELRMDKAAGRHLIHVLEPSSDQVLVLTTDRDTVAVGGKLGIHVDWRDGAASHAPERVEGLLTAPDGRSVDVRFKRDASGRYHGQASLPASAANVAGLWEVHVFAAARVDGAQLLRDAKTSFALTAPSARLADTFHAAQTTDGLQLALGVHAATAGRYELRGTLFGTRADGQLVPFAVSHAARMLDAGDGEITLKIAASLISEAGVQAPFELRDLSLENQGSFSRMESRAVALRLDAVSTAGQPQPPTNRH